MPALLLVRLMISLGLSLWFCGAPHLALAQEKRPATSEELAAPATSPDTLPRVLAAEAAALEGEVNALKSRVAAAQKDLKDTENDLQEITGKLAAFKASLALKTLPLTQTPEAENTFVLQQEKIHRRLGEINDLTEIFKKEQAAKEVAQAALLAEVNTLKAAGHPVARSPHMQEAYKKYQQGAAAKKQQAAQFLQSLQQTARLLELRKKLIADIQAELKKYADEEWKAGLLKRQEGLSFWQQVVWLMKSLGDLPARFHHWLRELLSSGQLRSLLKAHLARLIGLAVLIILISWESLRLSWRLGPRFLKEQAQAKTISAKGFFSLGHILAAHLLPLAWLLCLWLAFWIMGLPEGHAARLFFYLLVTLMALRLGCRLVQAAFADRAAGG